MGRGRCFPMFARGSWSRFFAWCFLLDHVDVYMGDMNLASLGICLLFILSCWAPEDKYQLVDWFPGDVNKAYLILRDDYRDSLYDNSPMFTTEFHNVFPNKKCHPPPSGSGMTRACEAFGSSRSFQGAVLEKRLEKAGMDLFLWIFSPLHDLQVSVSLLGGL